MFTYLGWGGNTWLEERGMGCSLSSQGPLPGQQGHVPKDLRGRDSYMLRSPPQNTVRLHPSLVVAL